LHCLERQAYSAATTFFTMNFQALPGSARSKFGWSASIRNVEKALNEQVVMRKHLLISRLQLNAAGNLVRNMRDFGASPRGFARVNEGEIKIASSRGFATFSSPSGRELRGGKTALIVCGSCERRRPQQHHTQSRVPRDGSPDGGLLTKGKL
jgi:hypothetical protein